MDEVGLNYIILFLIPGMRLDRKGSAEYCTPVWCCSTHTRLTETILNDALHIVTRCLRPTPTEDLPVLAGIHPAELRRLGATLSFSNLAIHDPDHVLHGQLVAK